MNGPGADVLTSRAGTVPRPGPKSEKDALERLLRTSRACIQLLPRCQAPNTALVARMSLGPFAAPDPSADEM